MFRISGGARRSLHAPARGSNLSPRSRQVRPRLEGLEGRLLLSNVTYTWTGGGDETTWSDASNWQENVNPPVAAVPPAGAAVIFPANSPGDTIDIDNADVSSITADASYTFEGDPNNNSNFVSGQLTLDNNASIITTAASSLDVQQPSDIGGSNLELDFAGTTTLEGGGSLGVYTQAIEYNGVGAVVLPIKIGSGTITIGSSTSMLKSNVTLGPGGVANIPRGSDAHIGSLSSSGSGGTPPEVDLGGTNEEDNTALSLNVPVGVSETFDGVIGGSGGVLSMDSENAPAGTNAAGTQTIESINPGASGQFEIDINAGTMLVNDTVNAQQLAVASGTTFGGSAAMTITGGVLFNNGAYFDVSIDGAAPGQFTTLTDTDEDADSQSTVELDGSKLSFDIGAGYVPKAGDTFTIISTPNGSIGGNFANAPGGSTVILDNVPFVVNYNQDGNGNVTSVSLTVSSLATTTGVAFASGSSNPTAYGQNVTLDATVALSGGGSETPIGTIEFFDGNPGSGGTEIGSVQTVNSSGGASLATSALSVGTHEIYAVYQPADVLFASSTSSPISDTVDPANTMTTIALARGSRNPAAVGENVTFDATVTATRGGSAIPTGTVEFFNGNPTAGGTEIGSPQSLNPQGTASISTSTLAVATNVIYVVYEGSTDFVQSASGPYGQIVQTSVGPTFTTTTLTSLDNPIYPGQPASFIATVSAGATGDVTFSLGTTILATVALSDNGSGVFTTSSLAPGENSITASFSSAVAGAFSPSSSSVIERVDPYTTIVSLTLVTRPLKHKGKQFELEAIVMADGAGGTMPLPQGTVAFQRGRALIGRSALQGGIALFAIGRTRPRHKQYTAIFQGNSDFSGASVAETV
jgi:hypothetical protein